MKLYKKYNQAFEYLSSLANIRQDCSITGTNDSKHYLRRAKLLLKLAGNPEKAAKKIIVVTGTSGKGTTCNLLRQILTQAGKKVGTYFSPHPTTAIERIKTNDLYISTDEFVQTVKKAKPIIEKCYQQLDAPSYFENFLLIALLYFKQKKCDYIIIEVGCGGRYDAANALSQIDIAAITNIGQDHLHIIGPTQKDIAYEKAGVIHQNVCFTTERKKRFLNIFQNEAKKTKSKLFKIDYEKNPNERLAKSIAEHLKIKNEIIEIAIQKARLPCHFEIIQKKPLIILDSAHNPNKLKYLSEKLKNLKTASQSPYPKRRKETAFPRTESGKGRDFPCQKLHLVFALSAPKDIKACLKPILNNFNVQIYATRFLVAQRNATDPKRICSIIKKHWPKTKCKIFLDPWQAFYAAKKSLKQKELLLITGSTYLCGELRKHWISEEQILKSRKSL